MTKAFCMPPDASSSFQREGFYLTSPLFSPEDTDRLSSAAIEELRGAGDPVECCLTRGGVLAMSPLLLQASSPALSPAHRWVIHIEYATDPLPDGLRWYEEQ